MHDDPRPLHGRSVKTSVRAKGALVSLPRRLGALGVLVVALVLPRASASFYVQSIADESRTPLHWKYTNCVAIRPNSAGTGDVQDGSDIEAIRRAAENWRAASESCSYLKIEILDPSPDAAVDFQEFGKNENTIVWIESGWTHDRNAAGITTVFFVDEKGNSQDGRILDADIEVNGEFFKYSTTDDRSRTDVENTVTHEMGHVMGLDHPCDDGARRPVPPDDAGNPIPKCRPELSLPQWLKDLTMYNFAEPGEDKKRSPEEEDVRGICEMYPLADAPDKCITEVDLTRSGCRVGAAAPGSSGWLLITLALLAGLAVAGRRRR